MGITADTVTLHDGDPDADETTSVEWSVHKLHRLPPYERKLTQYRLGMQITIGLGILGFVAWALLLAITGGATLPAGAGLALTAVWAVSKLMWFVWVHWFLVLADHCERHR